MRTAGSDAVLQALFRSDNEIALLRTLFDGDEHDATVSEIADASGVPLSTTSRALRRFEEAGLVSVTHRGRERIVRPDRDAYFAAALAALFRGPLPPLRQYEPLSLSRVAVHLGEAEARGTGERPRRIVIEFLEEYRFESRPVRQALLRAEPAATGDPRWDAFLGAVGEHLSVHDGFAPPAWVEDGSRFLDRWWFPVDLPAVRAQAIVEAPAAFRRRGIFILRRDLERV